jgi:hypothetical protein
MRLVTIDHFVMAITSAEARVWQKSATKVDPPMNE